MSRMSRVVLGVLAGVVSLALVAMGFVVGPGAVASVPSAESDFGVRFESDVSLAPFDAGAVAEKRSARVVEQGRVPGMEPGVLSQRVVEWREEHGRLPEGFVGGDVGFSEVSAAVTPTGLVRYVPDLPGLVTWGVEWDFVPNNGCSVRLYPVPATGQTYLAGGEGFQCNRTYFEAVPGMSAGDQFYAEVRLHDGTSWGPVVTSGTWGAVARPGLPEGIDEGLCVCDTSLGLTSPAVSWSVNPVNNATGAKVEQVRDVSLPGPGVVFDLSRVYSSQSEYTGMLGRGWMFPYEARLDVADLDRIVYHAESGQRAVYERNTSGELVSPAGTTSELVEVTGGFELRTRSHETLSFDASGRLTGWVDSSGQGLSFGYAGGVMSSVTDAAGRETAVSVTGGRVTSVTLPDGRSVSYGYDGDLLTSVTDLRGEIWSYGYDTADRLNAITDPLGRSVKEVTYDGEGRVVSQIDATGAESTWAYDSPKTGDTTYTDARGGLWTYTHSGNVLIQQIDPLGNVTDYGYDEDLNQVEVIDPRRNVTRRSFDDRGNMLSETNAAGHVRTWAYDADDNPIEHVGPTGVRSVFSYNTRHLPVREDQTSADGVDTRSRTWGYDARGLPTSDVSWGGREVTYTYDAAGNRVTETTGEGNTTRWSYDGSGRMLTETDPRGTTAADTYTTRYAYDDGDNVVQVTDPRGHQTGYAYDAVGNLETESHPDGSTTTYEWDAAGRQTSMLRSGWEQPETYVYYSGVDGRLGASTDATGATTRWGFDPANRMTSMRLPRGSLPGAVPDDHTYRYTYDPAGNRVAERDPAGNRTEFGYNVLNWMTSETDPAGGVTRYTYNRAGMVRTVTDPNGSQTVTQWDGFLREDRLADARGNVTTQTWGADDLLESTTTPLGNATSFAYDAEGRQVGMTDPHGQSWTLGYDPAGHETSVTDPLGNVTLAEFDEADNRTSLTDANGNTTGWAWDEMNRLVTVSGADGAETSYGYDQLGNLTSRTDPNGHVTTFGYDAVGRLLETIDPLGRKRSQTWDADGNMVETVTGRGHEAIADGGDPAPWTVGYEYDGRGLMTARRSTDRACQVFCVSSGDFFLV